MKNSLIRVKAIRKIKPLPRNIRFALDENVSLQGDSDRLLLTGWVIHRDEPVKQVTITRRDQTLAHGKLIVGRPRVQELYPDSPDSEQAGFSFYAAGLDSGNYELAAELENGEVLALARLELVQSSPQKLLFMHIPKAAGSTVNRFFASHYADSQHAIHIESNPDWQSDPDKIRALDFVSGHVSLPFLAKKLNLDEYFKVTVVREPFAQLVSHLAWIRRLADPGEVKRLERHPPYIQEFARKLRTADLSGPAAIANVCAHLEDLERRLVDNCLVRYFCAVTPGNPVSKADLDTALEACGEFNRIGVTDRIDDFLANVSITMGWKKPKQRINENVSQGYYGIDLKNREIRSALEPLVYFDLQLFRHIESTAD